MDTIRNFHKKPAHLPERLTISFPLWAVFAENGNEFYSDWDRVMREHVERGFNCLRLDSGAGLVHDLEGNPLPPANWGRPFGPYSRDMRGWKSITPGRVNVMERVKEMMRAAQRHDMYVILSSWYYLHTFWYNYDLELNEKLVYMDPHKRFDAFAKFLHYILVELEKEGLDRNIALCEIFNEADGLEFCHWAADGREYTPEEKHVFRAEHEAALAWLQQEHPQLLFAYDTATPWPMPDLAPANAQVYNAHNYYAWSPYTPFERDESWLVKERVSREEIEKSVLYPDVIQPGWIDRIYFYENFDRTRTAEAEAHLTAYFHEHYQEILDRLEEGVQSIEQIAETTLPGALVVNGEGVSYCGIDELHWEENCPEFWKMLETMVLRYRKAGLWGSVVRTNSEPADPVWYSHPEKLLHINKIFLNGKDE